MASPRTPAAVSTTMAPEAMADYLRERLGDRVVDTTIAYGQLLVTVTPEAWEDAARLAKEDPALACRYWEYMDAVDRGEDGFEGVVNLYSVEHRHRVTFKTMIPGGRDAPKLPTLTGLFRGANWSERETYDMFGVVFEGHPGLLPRILTVENFEGWPLRKEFLLSSREAKPWPGSKEPVEQETAEEGAAAKLPSEAPKSAEQKAAEARERAEKARQKAAAMRAEKAAARAQAEGATAEEAETAAEAKPEERGELAEAAEETGGGDTEGVAAEQAQAAAGKPEPQTPEGAADIARTQVAKDAAAGSVAGDTAAGAPGDEPGVDEPVHDPEAEAKAGEGAAPAPAGAPGIEEEGRHAGADLQEGERPAAETPGMDAEPGREGTAARDARETPAPPEEVGGIPETGQQQVPVKPLADSVDLTEQVEESATEANRPTSSEPPPPPSAGSGTDADDRRSESE